ncbi:MAG: MlaD family protein [Verrucomicrobiota bacterium]|jgi:phospholipid/cholesterol/gamma-HCH transport system substrate-binding protein
MKETLESRLGIFFIFAVIVTLVVLESLGGFAFLHRGYHVHAFFQNVQELKIGDFVKMSGVQIGRVQNIVLSNSLAEVTMNLDRNIVVKTDSKATISFAGLMAQNYVSLSSGSEGAPRAEEGAILQTVEQPDLGMLMAKLDNVASGVENLTRSFSGEKIDNLLGPFTDFLKNNQTNLSASIANVRTVTERIAQGKGTVGKLINEDTMYSNALNSISNLQSTAGDIDAAASKARELLTNANEVVLGVKAGRGTAGKLVTDDTLYIEAAGTMTNAHQILLKINRGQGSIGQLINDDSILKNAKLSLQKLDKATESLEDTGPLSVLGTMVSSLF